MGFANIYDYENFAKNIKAKNRFATDEKSQSFLRSFRDQAILRAFSLSKGEILYRAVDDYLEEINEDLVWISGCNEARILPSKEYAGDGRINSKGIVCLYLASSKETAVSEIRPWVKEGVTIAVMEIVRKLNLVNLSNGHETSVFSELKVGQLMGDDPIPQEVIDICVWNAIDRAFSRPVSRNEKSVEYVPTQILAEILKDMDFDGIIYKSAFGGEYGYNVALFDPADAIIKSANAYEITEIKTSFKEVGTAWFKR